MGATPMTLGRGWGRGSLLGVEKKLYYLKHIPKSAIAPKNLVDLFNLQQLMNMSSK